MDKKEYQKQYKEKNKEKLREYNRNYYEKHNRKEDSKKIKNKLFLFQKQKILNSSLDNEEKRKKLKILLENYDKLREYNRNYYEKSKENTNKEKKIENIKKEICLLEKYVKDQINLLKKQIENML